MNLKTELPQISQENASLIADLSKPVILEQDGQPMTVLISIEAYKQYQDLLYKQHSLTAYEARQLADKVVFKDLVGCALSSDNPIWMAKPTPQWRVPYRLFDGTLLATIDVDAITRQVALTDKERTSLLKKVEQSVGTGNEST